ncbi:MAG: D-aminoacylase [Anaerolineae bacterium]|nr:D-aminoacylase [Anaerolineae bacterium]
MDVIVRDVEVLDGSGSPAFRADVGLEGDRIAEVGDLSGATAPVLIDGAGLVAAPGFIDMHSHSDFTLPINPRAESKVRQGVTTEVIGMCGASPAPLTPKMVERRMVTRPELSWEWTTFASYLEALRDRGLSVNVVPLVGHGTIREAVVGLEDRRPAGDESAQMVRLVAQAMDEGAWGLSTGLIYPPGIYASTDELVEMSRIPASRGGFYFSHIRGEGPTLLQAVGEAIEIGERAGLPVQIAHFKAAEPENWALLPRALALVDDARARGLDVAADRYPYIASSTSLSASLPNWAHDGGREALLERLKQPATRRRILSEINASPPRWERTVLSHVPDCPELEGLNVAEVAGQRGADPSETALDIVLEAGARVSIIRFGMLEENLRSVLRHPAVMIGSDGSARAPYGPLGEGKAHPRNYGTFPRVLAKYVREEGVLSLPEAVHKMSGLPAKRLRLSDRGRLGRGLKADLVLFDPQAICDRGTFTDPYQYPTGIAYVYVNGEAVITPDGHTGALPGRILRH